MIRTLKFSFILCTFLLSSFCIPAKAEVSLLEDNIFIQDIKNHNIRSVQTRLLKGTSPNMKSASGQPALLVAASMGSPELIQLLIEHRATLNTKDEDGNTALAFASGQRNPEALAILLSYKPKINLANKDGMTPLMLAAEKGLIQNVKLLVEKGAAVNRTDYTGKTAADIAAENNQQSVVNYLNGLTVAPAKED